MRAEILVLGIILAVVGGALVLSPINETHTYDIRGPANPAPPIGMSMPYALGDTILYNVSWIGGSNSTDVLAYDCGTNSHCTGNLTMVAAVSGVSGAFTVGVAPGHYLLLNATAELNVTVVTSFAGSYGLIGLPPFLFGIVLIAYGWISYPADARARGPAARRQDAYLAGMTILLLILGMVVGYMFTLGPLNSLGTESAFAIALALGLLDVGLIFHILDVAYRDASLEISHKLVK